MIHLLEKIIVTYTIFIVLKKVTLFLLALQQEKI